MLSAGYNKREIAQKLGVFQSTISRKISKFKKFLSDSEQLADIRRNLFRYRAESKKFREFLGSKYQSMTDKALKQLNEEYERKLALCTELDRILCKLYEDNALGKISDSRYETEQA